LWWCLIHSVAGKSPSLGGAEDVREDVREDCEDVHELVLGIKV
jgi:hypothetical protein